MRLVLIVAFVFLFVVEWSGFAAFLCVVFAPVAEALSTRLCRAASGCNYGSAVTVAFGIVFEAVVTSSV